MTIYDSLIEYNYFKDNGAIGTPHHNSAHIQLILITFQTRLQERGTLGLIMKVILTTPLDITCLKAELLV